MFNFGKFLRDKFRSHKEVVQLLRAYNAKQLPQEAAVMKWFQRETIPSEWFPVLLAYLEIEEGGPVRLAKYLKGAQS